MEITLAWRLPWCENDMSMEINFDMNVNLTFVQTWCGKDIGMKLTGVEKF